MLLADSGGDRSGPGTLLLTHAACSKGGGRTRGAARTRARMDGRSRWASGQAAFVFPSRALSGGRTRGSRGGCSPLEDVPRPHLAMTFLACAARPPSGPLPGSTTARRSDAGRPGGPGDALPTIARRLRVAAGAESGAAVAWWCCSPAGPTPVRDGARGPALRASRTGSAQLAEIPADDLRRRHPQPAVPAVVDHLVAPDVLAGEGALDRLRSASGPPLRGTSPTTSTVPEISTPRSSRNSSPASTTTPMRGSRCRSAQRRLRLERVQPQHAAVPDEPERGGVRPVGTGGRDPAGPLGGQERVALRLGHGDRPAPPLLLHRHPLLTVVLAGAGHDGGPGDHSPRGRCVGCADVSA